MIAVGIWGAQLAGAAHLAFAGYLSYRDVVRRLSRTERRSTSESGSS